MPDTLSAFGASSLWRQNRETFFFISFVFLSYED
jgi:hypothetical protein